MKKSLLVFFITLLLLAFSGCAKLHEDMEISADGSVTATYEVVANEILYDDLMKAQARLKADKIEPAAEGKMKGFTATYNVDQLENLPARMNEFAEIDGKVYQVVKQSNFFYDRYALNFAPTIGNKYMEQGSKKKPSGEKDPNNPEYTFTLHLPSANEETNADDVSADGRTLTWDFTDNFFTSGKAGTVAFRIWNRAHILLIAIFIALCIAGATFSMVQFRKAPASKWKGLFAGFLVVAIAVAGWSVYTVCQTPAKGNVPMQQAQQQKQEEQSEEPSAIESLAGKAKSAVTGEPTITQLDSKTVGGAISTTTVTTKEETDEFGTLKTPVVQLADESIAEKINTDIQQAVSAIAGKRGPNTGRDNRTFDVKCDTADTLSIVICEIDAPKGGNGNHAKYVALTYDKRTGVRKSLSDYSNITAQDVEVKAQSQLLAYKNGENATKYVLNASSPKMDQLFVTQDGKVWLLFQPYNMAAGVAGATCIQVQ